MRNQRGRAPIGWVVGSGRLLMGCLGGNVGGNRNTCNASSSSGGMLQIRGGLYPPNSEANNEMSDFNCSSDGGPFNAGSTKFGGSEPLISTKYFDGI